MGRAKKGGKQRGRGAATPGPLARLRALLKGFFLGDEVEEQTLDHLQEIKGLALMGLAVWLTISMASFYDIDRGALAGSARAPEGFNWGGLWGYTAARWSFLALGWAGYAIPFLCMAWGLVLLARKFVTWPTMRVFGGVCFLICAALWLELAVGGAIPPGDKLPYGVGGWMAREAVPQLRNQFGGPGLWVILTLGVTTSFMLATQMAFYPAVVALREWIQERRDAAGESLGAALWGWTRRLFRGLWSFLRGEDIVLDPQPRAAARPKSKAKPKPKQAKAAKQAAVPAPEELFEEEEEEGEEEWEYFDEDGNPVDEEDWEEEEDEEWEEEEEEEEEEELQPEPRPKPAKAKRASVTQQSQIVFDPPTPPPGPWKLPPIEVLEPPGKTSAEDGRAIEQAAQKLENALGSFRVDATVVHAQVGPTVTLYELDVAQGTRMNKVTQLSQEIAAALRAKSVRIIAPIPGKATIGIEVPNNKRRLVRLSELITQKAYDRKFASLPMFLGMDAEGRGVVEDLARMPHLLIAGTTGSGKSVCINTILASLLLTRSPHDVQLILVDPKMVELQMFAKVPHLMLPIVNDMRHAANVLNWAVEKMEGRYELFKNAGVRNIKGYNELGEKKLREKMGDEWHEERTPRHVPFIVIVIDEMADLMMTSKKEVEQAVTRLAQKSRAVGIHVIVATQRPSTDVITGVLKGNLPTRIAFQVASKVDSRVIMDSSGAEKLLGGGDMLYAPPQASQLLRVQGALVEDHELQNMVDFVTQESAPTFSQELVQAATGTAAGGATPGSGADQDELFDEAVRVVLKTKRGSASLLQRALGIGYTRASRLIDITTAEGIVGEHKGSKARELLMTLEDWEEMHGAPLGHGANDE